MGISITPFYSNKERVPHMEYSRSISFNEARKVPYLEVSRMPFDMVKNNLRGG
jgi:hypothetical protein